jgi:uncharacterized NAD(P)/FAD-binding protein YdhS
MDSFDLAVVGGGPAGLATVLAAQAQAPHWRVCWYRGTRAGFLPAYAGLDPVHRLNVPVERMGLDAERPHDFLAWLRARHPERGAQPGDFVPRNWFGDYLEARMASLPAPPGLETREFDVQHLVRDAAGWRLIDARGGEAHARRVALCLGLPGGQAPPHAPAHWIADPWAWWRALPQGRLPLAADATVLLVGSGLTAVDLALGLRARGFAGTIRVVSTSGRWSTAHAPTPPLPAAEAAALDAAAEAAGSARGLLRLLRAHARRHPWRAVVDALRAGTCRYWAALPLAEQARLLRHAFGAWNRHRHRMAPDVLAALEADAGLRLERGRILVDADGRIHCRRGDATLPVEATLVLDCRGPAFHAALSGDGLLARLVREGVLDAHPLGTGVRRRADASLAVLGAARFGEAFETLAIPELRQQAVDVLRDWQGGAGA